jgi:hypothetical protein
MQHVIHDTAGKILAYRSKGSLLAQSPQQHSRTAIRDRLPTPARAGPPGSLLSSPVLSWTWSSTERRGRERSRVIGHLGFKHRSNHTGHTTWKSLREHPLVRVAIPISRSSRPDGAQLVHLGIPGAGCKHVSARLRIRKLWLLLSIKEAAMTPIISFLFGSCAHDKRVPHHVRSDK